ncbi:DNA-packaging protein [Rubellimicrobium sp. CFH 75288]|uniref:DNA-packaging protein n=1 Tax=Rubellimicrobium sp. CFH 75288 TaxID=2697034 RepID=UPI001411EF47|nr:terminase family protein [Rubellimicrobium sp. CFH 75288]NAZ35527.1 ATP-binding protein [Rubellimicrobium sp. CFH 75288]
MTRQIAAPTSPLARRLAALGPAALDALPPATLAALPFLWDLWALPHQLPPPGPWRTWVALGGRGAGKTRAGAEWVRSLVEGPRPADPGRCRRVALVAETADQAREVMVMGESGILACSPPDRRPRWIATRRMLLWPNGATAQTFSACDPESLRGPQFDAAWADELAKWRRGPDAWAMLQMGLRLGPDPRAVVTTTPRPSPLLDDILRAPGTVQTHAATGANRANLAPDFLDRLDALYGGTRLARQEIAGERLETQAGALWSPALLESCRAPWRPAFDRVVVAVDPAVSTGKSADSTGIVAAGAVMQGAPRDWRAVVLEDATVRGASPEEWGRAAIACARRHDADRIVAEDNQGGAMVESILRGIDPTIAVTRVRARSAKGIRAEPVAALYEQGRVHHLRGADLAALEDQMRAMTAAGWRGRGSPDRLDALVWAVHALLVAPAATWSEPRLRAL